MEALLDEELVCRELHPNLRTESAQAHGDIFSANRS
jgi:hypothetical protein